MILFKKLFLKVSKVSHFLCISSYYILSFLGIREEWQQVAGTFPTNTAATLYEYNQQRNFPGGCPCLDASRVHLSLDVPPQTEYIHANWVATAHSDLPKLIITQAPQDFTVKDFWRSKLYIFERMVNLMYFCSDL